MFGSRHLWTGEEKNNGQGPFSRNSADYEESFFITIGFYL